MRFKLSTALLAAGFLAPCAGPEHAIADESLFSHIAMESVYESKTVTPLDVAAISDTSMLERVTGASSLVLALKAAGFNPTRDDEQVTIEVDHAGWKLPIRMRVELEKDRIVCAMSLVELKDMSGVASDSLLSLLASGKATEGAFFAFDRDKKLIQLKTSFSNRGLTARGLKADLVNLASLAELHSDVWSKLGTAVKTDAVVGAPERKTVPAKEPAESFSIVGRWGATLTSGESFAILVGADNRFKLVQVKGKKSSVSSGKLTLEGNRLTLVGDDKVTISGDIKQSSKDEFQFAIIDAKTGKPSVTLSFKKA